MSTKQISLSIMGSSPYPKGFLLPSCQKSCLHYMPPAPHNCRHSNLLQWPNTLFYAIKHYEKPCFNRGSSVQHTLLKWLLQMPYDSKTASDESLVWASDTGPQWNGLFLSHVKGSEFVFQKQSTAQPTILLEQSAITPQSPHTRTKRND